MKIKIYKKLIIAAISSLIVAFFYLEYLNKQIEERIYNQVRVDVQRDYFEDKKNNIEFMFHHVYESIRMISLLPSIRSLKGDNRHSIDENIEQTRKFSADGLKTIQQIYNNLAENISVSEVYVTANGFLPEEGQVPFLMYDAEIINGGLNSSGEQKFIITDDFPPEYEWDEYLALNKQMKVFTESYPSFNYKTLKSIPALSTNSMRTCDNTQYISETTGDVKNAFGFIISVPFYNEANIFNGVVSGIVRLNIFEAELLDIPFIPITKYDQQRAIDMNFELPNTLGGFVLYNKNKNIYIADRRNTGLIDKVQSNDKALIYQVINTPDVDEWYLALEIPSSFYENALIHERKIHYWRKVILFLLVLFSVSMLYGSSKLSAAQKELYEKNTLLQKLSETDKLTGLSNRLHLDNILLKEGIRNKRYKNNSGVILMDIDHFKIVNDEYGHIVGDSVLMEFANILKNNFRVTDTVGRWGGEEFLIICPEISSDDLEKLAEKIRILVEDFSFKHVGRITASFGLTLFKPGEESYSMLNRVDNALYQAKDSGRNQVVLL